MLKQKSKLPKVQDGVPLYDNILVKAIDVDVIDEETQLYRPQGYEDKPELGEVIKVGEGRIFDNGTVVPLKVKIGDLVYWNKYSSVKIRFGTEDFYLLREEDIQMRFAQ